jgi:cell division protein FtsW
MFTKFKDILNKIIFKIPSFWLTEQANAHKNHQSQKQGEFDFGLLVITFCLMSIGLVMVYSSSIDQSKDVFQNTDHFFSNQLKFAILGIILMISISYIPYLMWKRLAIFILILTLFGLVAVLYLAKEVNGAYRWISLGPVNIQPAELFKIAWINYMAYIYSDMTLNLNHLLKQLRYLSVAVIWAVLLFLQPDIGSLLFSLIFTAGIVILAGLPISLVILILFVFGMTLIVVAPFQGHVAQRLLKFFGEDEIHYNIKQGIISFSKGHKTGLGLGQSQQKFDFLPESHTDFIFNIIGEEFGFLGALTVLTLFILFLYRGIKISIRASTVFGSLLSSGLTIFIVFQAFFNMGMALDALPTKGLTLPFISYGGTSLLTFCCCVGVLLNISKQGRYSKKEAQLLRKKFFLLSTLKEQQELSLCKSAQNNAKKKS